MKMEQNNRIYGIPLSEEEKEKVEKELSELKGAEANHPKVKVSDEESIGEIQELYQQIANVDIDKMMSEVKDDDDRVFLQIRIGMVFINAINTLMGTEQRMANFVKMLLPDSAEKTKIILARLEDIDPNKIDDLSLSFIENLFNIEGTPVRVTMPEGAEVSDVEYKRLVIRQIKIFDEQAAVIDDYVKDIKERLNKHIPEDIQAMLADPIKLDEWMISYFERKAQSQDITEEQREEYKKKLQAKEDGWTLRPMLDNIKQQINEKGNARSIRNGFYRMQESVMTSAINIAQHQGFSFPFNLMNDLDEKLLTEKEYNDKYKNLYVFLLARYIKYKGDHITEVDKVFITSAVSNIILLSRPNMIERYPKQAGLMHDALLECISLISK